MEILYSDQKCDIDYDRKSIFLAGPTPRSQDVPSWRPEALKILEDAKFKGIVYVPERSDWNVKFDYFDQISWERKALENSTAIVFWVPRNMQNMPALTTNVEFGTWLAKTPKKVFYGRPDDSEHTRYLDWLYMHEQKNWPFFNNLSYLLHYSLEFVVSL